MTTEVFPENNAISPRTFAKQHMRSQSSFRGCSRISNYEQLGKLGEGTFGEVHRARSKKTGAIVALKKILMHHEKDGFPITALREIKLLKLLSHPNVLRLEEMAIEHHKKTSDKKKRAVIYMVTPYMDHDLAGLLENPSIIFTEPQIKCYLMQLLEGLKYLHNNHILHRDMKAANLLINNKGILQIADFGLARHYDEPVPVAGGGGGEAHRDYTVLVVTRWYRPPELLLQLRKYTTAIDLWGVGCVFGEMLIGKPILAGESDANQLKIIFDLVGTPTNENMPNWRSLPGAELYNVSSLPQTTGTLSQNFRTYGSGAISLLKELLKLDWRKRINAIDALNHPYFRNDPLPARPEDLPKFEESHELDRRKFRGQKAALPPAPKGGTVGMGQHGSWEATVVGNEAGTNSDGYHPYRQSNGARYSHHASYRNSKINLPSGTEERRPTWSRSHDRPDARLPPRPPPADYTRGDRSDAYRPRSREFERAPHSSRIRTSTNIDTYIPSYSSDGGRRDDRRSRERDERAMSDRSRNRRRDDRHERRY
ncbi:putative serine threonine-protein kinase bur-1 [Erysiphe necator]|uniref:Serine/threonine-protein kinase BUR1 n=1 Tax=Uncinula necator TaxID=52586 RepID=A0A0B1P1D9_UNCNE|nr:putative serine threonine-protein kinase bur-1 [Erysiphe necator]